MAVKAHRSPRALVIALALFGALACAAAGPIDADAGHRHSRHHHRHHHGGRRHLHRHHHRHRHVRQVYLPPKGRVFHGVSDTKLGLPDVTHFQHQVGAHPAVLEDFYHWGTPLTTGALQRWHQSHTRGILSLSTGDGGLPELISPGQIAEGRGDDYLIKLNESIKDSGQVVYIRLMPEMNGSWNRYSAYTASGHLRNKNHSTSTFREAWRRFAIVVRGGAIKGINKRLRAQGMRPLLRAKGNNDPIYRKFHVHGGLDHPKVALIWNPQTISSPDIAGNQPSDYWPGRRYVDWVGADIYSKYATPGVRAALTSFYRHHAGLPMMIGEYSPWDNDRSGAFVRWLFKWAKQHGRTRMLVYYRSVFSASPYDIGNFPRARASLRHILNSHRFMEYAPGTRHHKHHRRH